MVVPNENARIVVEGRFFISRIFYSKFGFQNINSFCKTIFLINKRKNRGKFLFTS
jgi:hypothetical protein